MQVVEQQALKNRKSNSEQRIIVVPILPNRRVPVKTTKSIKPICLLGSATLRKSERKAEGPCFWTAWNNHREYLRRLSMVWMNISAADAEDALSAATIRAHEKYLANAHLIVNERAWFARLLHNICIDIHRSNKRRSKLGDRVKEVVLIDASEADNVDLTPEAELLNSELGGTISIAINDLPVKLQTPLIMRLVKGDDYSEIALALNISNDNARKRVQQARAILRQKLSFLRDE
ncbi:MAG: sigma-70 family RNA polymerase sigma factor [Sneathiella sp.]